jgi:hypothetical protein
MFKIPENLHKNIYLAALILIAVSLPFSVFTLSIAQIILVVNWISEGKFEEKWLQLKQKPAVWIISLFYLVHLLGMVYTSDFSWGFHDLRIKLPMLVLPVIIGTSTPLYKNHLKIILNFFIAAVLTGSFYSASIFWELIGNPLNSKDQIYPFISHIRWALIIDLSIVIMFWLFKNTKIWLKWFYVISIMWLVTYTLLINGLTGVVILISISLFLLIRSIFYKTLPVYRWGTVVLVFIIFIIIVSFLCRSYSRFYTFEKVDTLKIDTITSKGNRYYHDFKNKSVENGFYTYIYICEPELLNEWKKRSDLDFYGQTKNKGNLKHVLIRFMTSKGLHKDSAGFSHLSQREIQFIESGITNSIDTNKYSLYPFVYKAIWELYNYKMGANPSGYSIAQRLEFLKTASHIIKNNAWLGVGTGDVPNAFSQQYIIDNSLLLKEHRLRSHNQLVTFWLTFGPFGLAIILFSLVVPGFFERKFSDYLFLCIFMTGFMSFLNEDTLETHTGISFFAFFYALFLFYCREKFVPNTLGTKKMKISHMAIPHDQ